MGEGKKEEIPNPTTLNPFDPKLDPVIQQAIVDRFAMCIRKAQAGLHHESYYLRKKKFKTPV